MIRLHRKRIEIKKDKKILQAQAEKDSLTSIKNKKQLKIQF